MCEGRGRQPAHAGGVAPPAHLRDFVGDGAKLLLCLHQALLACCRCCLLRFGPLAWPATGGWLPARRARQRPCGQCGVQLPWPPARQPTGSQRTAALLLEPVASCLRWPNLGAERCSRGH